MLSPEHSTTLPEDLIALINYLPPDDPEAHYLILQLTYMLGYTYEQEGREEEAIATYLALIQQAPESPWSWLAWARIEPGE
ncbi:MAG: tetratricopeptide repeat protein [Chloroflexi bacterium]|nr:tetratricopeptide repeat protein [Chloroflexota bacterium]